MADELTWQAVLVQAIPVLGGALAALLGALPGYFKDKRELAARERLAAEERAASRENERQAKAYEERKNAYIDLLKTMKVASVDTKNDWNTMIRADEAYASLRLFCSDAVFTAANLGIQALRTYLLKQKKEPYGFFENEYTEYLNAFDNLVAEMRQDLSVHKTELC